MKETPLTDRLSYKVAKSIPGLLPVARNVLVYKKERGYQKGRVSYSQHGEDLIIRSLFSQMGIARPSYIDIGAHHPFYLSNTAIFYTNGSRGINIEPDPKLFSRFTAKRPGDVNLNIGIGPKADQLTFYTMADPAFNTFSLEEAKKCETWGCTIVSETKVAVETLSDVLRKYNKGKFPDLMSLDVEGLDEVIVRSIDFKQSSPSVICVETISYENAIGIKNYETVRTLEGHGYTVYADTYINTILVKKSQLKTVT